MLVTVVRRSTSLTRPSFTSPISRRVEFVPMSTTATRIPTSMSAPEAPVGTLAPEGGRSGVRSLRPSVAARGRLPLLGGKRGRGRLRWDLRVLDLTQALDQPLPLV